MVEITRVGGKVAFASRKGNVDQSHNSSHSHLHHGLL